MASILWFIVDSVTSDTFVVDSPTQPTTSPLSNPVDPTKTQLLNAVERNLADGTIGYVVIDASGGIAVFAKSGTTFTKVVAPTKTVELDFGSPGTRSKTFTITDADVSASSVIQAWQSGVAATGRSADENEMDQIVFRAVPGAGSLTLYANSLFGPVSGLYKVNYSIR